MFRNSRRLWNVRAMPRRVILYGSQAGDALAGEADVAVGRLVDAGDHVEDRGLAGAVGADHADDLALVDAEVELGQGLAGRRTRARACRVRAGPSSHTTSTRLRPSSPCGRAFIITIRIAPSRIWRVIDGLGDEHALPHAGGEVQRRHQQDRRASALDLHERDHQDQQQRRSRCCRRASGWPARSTQLWTRSEIQPLDCGPPATADGR